MGKPASGASLDAGNSLYSHLTAAGSAVWAMLEGSGTTSADSSGNGHGLTLDGTCSWSTDGAGNAIVTYGGAAGGHACAVTGPPDLAGTSSWSFAWRGKITGANTFNVFAGGEASGSNIDFVKGVRLEFDSKAGGSYKFDSYATDFLNDHDYLLVYDQPNARLHLYVDGAEVTGSPLTVASNDAAVKFASLGAGFDGSDSFSILGSLTYGYLMAGYAASSTDASNLHADPYSIFSAGGGSPAPHLLSSLGVGA